MWSDGEVDGVNFGIGIGYYLGQGLDFELLEFLLRHQNNGTSSIVDFRGVGGSDGASLAKSGFEGRYFFLVISFEFFVFANLLLSCLGFDCNGHDFLFENASLAGSDSAIVALDTVCILGLAGKFEIIGCLLGAKSHSDLIKGISKSVLVDGI